MQFEGRCGGWGVLLAVLVASSPARAADIESVESLIRQGVELRHQGHDVRALPLFQKAYGMTRTPRTAGQLGLCEMAMGYWLDAERHLSDAVSDPEHPWVAKNLNDLTGALAAVRRNISDVVVDGGPPGAEVLVNGQSAGHLPLPSPLRLAKGAADIELRAPGYVATARSVRIAGGVPEHVTIVLAPSSPIAAPPIGSGEAPVRPTPEEAQPPVPASGGEPSKTSPLRIVAWVTAGVAGLALAFGVVETFNWANAQKKFDDHTGPLPSDPTVVGKNCGGADAHYGGTDCQGLHDNLLTARTWALVGYSIGGALGITSIILFATSSADGTKTDTAFTCAPDLAHRGVGCGFSF